MIENPNVICNDCAYCKQNKELRERLKKTQELELEVRRECNKLKELMKGAKEIIEWYKDDCGYRDTPTEVVLQHINQALGEDK